MPETRSGMCRSGFIATLVICTILYIGVAMVLTGIVPWQSVMGDAAPVVNALKRLTLARRAQHDAALDAAGGAVLVR